MNNLKSETSSLEKALNAAIEELGKASLGSSEEGAQSKSSEVHETSECLGHFLEAELTKTVKIFVEYFIRLDQTHEEKIKKLKTSVSSAVDGIEVIKRNQEETGQFSEKTIDAVEGDHRKFVKTCEEKIAQQEASRKRLRTYIKEEAPKKFAEFASSQLSFAEEAEPMVETKVGKAQLVEESEDVKAPEVVEVVEIVEEPRNELSKGLLDFGQQDAAYWLQQLNSVPKLELGFQSSDMNTDGDSESLNSPEGITLGGTEGAGDFDPDFDDPGDYIYYRLTNKARRLADFYFSCLLAEKNYSWAVRRCDVRSVKVHTYTHSNGANVFVCQFNTIHGEGNWLGSEPNQNCWVFQGCKKYKLEKDEELVGIALDESEFKIWVE